jgi:hypothetical protein
MPMVFLVRNTLFDFSGEMDLAEKERLSMMPDNSMETRKGSVVTRRGLSF